jgi:hypothetical protein
MEAKFVQISTLSGKQPEQPLKMHPMSTNLHQISQRANTGGQGEIGTLALWDVPIFLKPTPNDS